MSTVTNHGPGREVTMTARHAESLRRAGLASNESRAATSKFITQLVNADYDDAIRIVDRALRSCPPEVGRIRVRRLLISIPRWGEERVRRVLLHVGLPVGDWQLKRLTARQRNELAAALHIPRTELRVKPIIPVFRLDVAVTPQTIDAAARELQPYMPVLTAHTAARKALEAARAAAQAGGENRTA